METDNLLNDQDLNEENLNEAKDSSKILEELILNENFETISNLPKSELLKLCNLALERRNVLKNSNKNIQHKLVSNVYKSKPGVNASIINQNQSSIINNETLHQYNNLLKEYAEVDKKLHKDLKENARLESDLKLELDSKSEMLENLDGKKSATEKSIIQLLSSEKGNKEIVEDINKCITQNIINQDLENIQLKNIKLN